MNTARLARTTLAVLGTLAVASLANPAFALLLGEARVLSRHAEPLVIEVIARHQPGDPSGPDLAARIAGPSVYSTLGLEYPVALADARIRARAEQDRTVIRIESRQAFRELWLSLVLEVDAGTGSLRRQYDLLLEPATADAPNRAPVNRDISEPSVFAAARAEGGRLSPTAEEAVPRQVLMSQVQLPSVPKSETRAAKQAAKPPTPPREAASRAAARTHLVRPGETLGAILDRYFRGARDRRKAIAEVVAGNPGAFRDGNPDRLYAGVTLMLPGAASAPAEMAVEQALARVRTLTERAEKLGGEIEALEKRRLEIDTALRSALASAQAPKGSTAMAAAAPSEPGAWAPLSLTAGGSLFALLVGFVAGRRWRRGPEDNPLPSTAPASAAEPSASHAPLLRFVKARSEGLDFTAGPPKGANRSAARG